MDCKTASHQHLSNFIWWHTGVLGKGLSYCAEQVTAIIERFENKILPYRPSIWRNDELLTLVDKGLIYCRFSGEVLIIHGKRVIGEILPYSNPYQQGLKSKT